MTTWASEYTDQQRQAIYTAYFVSRIENQSHIGRLARAGELTFEGQQLDAFNIPDATVRSWLNTERRRRAGAARSELVKKTPEDAVEALRRRLVSFLDHETLRIDKQMRTRPNIPLDVEHIRRLVRTVRELAALPGPGERGKPATKPTDGRLSTGEPKPAPDSQAGKLMAAMKPGTAENDAHIEQSDNGDHSAADTDGNDATQTGEQRPGDDAIDDPGLFARRGIQGLTADHVSVS